MAMYHGNPENQPNGFLVLADLKACFISFQENH